MFKLQWQTRKAKKPQNTSELIRLHVVVHSILDPNNLFNFEKLKVSPSTNYFLGQSRTFLCNPKTYQIYSATNFEQNKFTKSLQIVKIEFGPQGDFVEGISNGMLHSEGIWTLVDEETSKVPALPINNKDVFKFGQQVIRIQLCNPQQTGQLNDNFKSLYSHIFREYDLQDHNDFDFVKGFQETEIPNDGDTSVRNSAMSMGGNRASCRICLESERPSKPFARNICKCSESMPIHGECLLDYIKAKCKATPCKKYKYYDLTHLACDVCKEQYPPFIEINDEKTPLLKIKYDSQKPFALIEIYKIDSSQIKNIVLLEMSKKSDDRLTIGSHQNSSIQFKNDLISPFHAALTIKSEKLFMFNLDKRYGTLRKIESKVKLETLHMRVLISGKFSFLFHVFSKSPCTCFKKGLKAIKTDPIEVDPKINEKEFETIKKELKSFGRKENQLENNPNVTTEFSMNSNGPERQKATTVIQTAHKIHERPISSERKLNSTVSDNFISEVTKKQKDDTQSFQILQFKNVKSQQKSLEIIEEQTKKKEEPTKNVFEVCLDEEIQEKKSKRITKAKRVENDFCPTLMDGPALPRPSIGTSELYFNSDANFHFE